MKDTFDLRRFGLYARKEFSENWKAYALSLVGLSAIMGYNIYQDWNYVHSNLYDKKYPLEIYSYLAIAMGPMTWIASSYLLKSFSNRQQTFATLTLPVSSFEQFLYAWMIAVPFATFICYVLWKIAWSVFLPYFLNDIPNLLIGNDSNYWTGNPYVSVFFLGGSAIFMWGAVTLGRLNFLKVLGILITVGLLLFEWGPNRLLKATFPNAYHIRKPAPAPWIPQMVTIESSKGVFSNDIHSTFEEVYQFWWVLCVPLLLYTITYLKIKEKEV
jgi:hypothetical protein